MSGTMSRFRLWQTTILSAIALIMNYASRHG